jgi:hypothetical protein
VDFRLLGPLEPVGDDGRLIELPAGKPRVLLALLLVDAGRVVSVDRLVAGLWGEPGGLRRVDAAFVSDAPLFETVATEAQP